MKKKSKKVIISGYYGFNNFGDDAILEVLVREVKNLSDNIEIVVLSNKPQYTSDKLDVKSIHRLKLFNIIKEFIGSNVLISGGGSLLQDVTGPFTLYYYLGIILLAKLLNTKVFIYSQGIGPINTKAGKIITKFILKLSDTITVRDNTSLEFLKQLNINADITADPVWLGLSDLENNNLKNKKEHTTIGINLRPWKALDENRLKALADAITETFDNNIKLKLLPLQHSLDYDICIKFKNLLIANNPELEIECISEELTPSKYDELIQECDGIIAMRFHALISSLTHNIKTFGLSYDPKVTSLMEESNTDFVEIHNLDKNVLTHKLKTWLSDETKSQNNEFVNKNIKLARENLYRLKCLLGLD